MKIAITGPESTGKSMLAEHLAGHYRACWVPEFARSFIDNLGRPYREEDILTIAKGQLMDEKKHLKNAKEYLFCDTELIVTKIWSEFKYSRCDPWILKNIEQNPYHLFLLCNIDLPWEADPQREHPHLRLELFDLYYQELTRRKFPFRVVSGFGNTRFTNAINFVEELKASGSSKP